MMSHLEKIVRDFICHMNEKCGAELIYDSSNTAVISNGRFHFNFKEKIGENSIITTVFLAPTVQSVDDIIQGIYSVSSTDKSGYPVISGLFSMLHKIGIRNITGFFLSPLFPEYRLILLKDDYIILERDGEQYNYVYESEDRVIGMIGAYNNSIGKVASQSDNIEIAREGDHDFVYICHMTNKVLIPCDIYEIDKIEYYDIHPENGTVIAYAIRRSVDGLSRGSQQVYRFTFYRDEEGVIKKKKEEVDTSNSILDSLAYRCFFCPNPTMDAEELRWLEKVAGGASSYTIEPKFEGNYLFVDAGSQLFTKWGDTWVPTMDEILNVRNASGMPSELMEEIVLWKSTYLGSG